MKKVALLFWFSNSNLLDFFPLNFNNHKIVFWLNKCSLVSIRALIQKHLKSYQLQTFERQSR